MYYGYDPYGEREGLIEEQLHRCPVCGSVMLSAADGHNIGNRRIWEEWLECPSCGYCEKE